LTGIITKFIISIGYKIIPNTKLRRKLARRFENQITEYRKSLKNPTEFTFCSKKRMKITLGLLEKCINEDLEGDVIECGVYKGGSSFQIAKKLQSIAGKKTLFALDTFEGHPYDDAEDMPKKLVYQVYQKKKQVKKKGFLNDVNLNEIKNHFAKENLDNTVFLKGLFEDSFKKISDKNFCFAHVDADFYLSVKQCVEFLKKRMVPNGIIVFDDYNDENLPGCTKAVDELLGKESLFILPDKRAYWIKKDF